MLEPACILTFCWATSRFCRAAGIFEVGEFVEKQIEDYEAGHKQPQLARDAPHHSEYPLWPVTPHQADPPAGRISGQLPGQRSLGVVDLNYLLLPWSLPSSSLSVCGEIQDDYAFSCRSRCNIPEKQQFQDQPIDQVTCLIFHPT